MSAVKKRKSCCSLRSSAISTRPWEEWEALWCCSGPGAERTCNAWITAFSVASGASLCCLQISVLWSLNKSYLYGFRHSLCRCSFPVREGSFMLYQSHQGPLGIHGDQFCFLHWLKALPKTSNPRKSHTLLLPLQKSPLGWKNFRN